MIKVTTRAYTLVFDCYKIILKLSIHPDSGSRAGQHTRRRSIGVSGGLRSFDQAFSEVVLRSFDQAFSKVVLGPVTERFSGCLGSFDHAGCFRSFDQWGVLVELMVGKFWRSGVHKLGK